MHPSEPAQIGAADPPAPAPAEQDLLSSVCHDLKAPLASIVMGGGFLRRVLSPEDASARRVVDAMLRAAERMNQVIASFADLARLEAGTLRLELGLHDPRAAARAACTLLADEVAAQGIELLVAVDAMEPQAPVPLRCDYGRLVQCFRMLGACALRVAPEGGRITMRIKVSGDGAVTSTVSAQRVAESGRRITAELPKPELAIARGLVELHGSNLVVERDDSQVLMSFVLQGQPLLAI